MARTYERNVYLNRITDDDKIYGGLSVNTRGIQLQQPQCLKFVNKFQLKKILAGLAMGVGIALFAIYINYWIYGDVEWTLKNDSVTEDHLPINNLFSSIIQRIMWAVFFGLLFGGCSWGIIYIDSAVPGILPPTPLSPKDVRRASGHTFHSGYIIAILNGFFVCLYSLLRAFYCNNHSTDAC